MKHTAETKKKISQARVGISPWNKGLKGYMAGKKHHWFGRNMSGENNPTWKGGPRFWKRDDRRNDSAYRGWVKLVKERDGKRCKIRGKDCDGRLEVHHILGWRQHPELRYEINNGITLCRVHHPRKRADENRLVSLFQGLVSIINKPK